MRTTIVLLIVIAFLAACGSEPNGPDAGPLPPDVCLSEVQMEAVSIAIGEDWPDEGSFHAPDFGCTTTDGLSCHGGGRIRGHYGCCEIDGEPPGVWHECSPDRDVCRWENGACR